MKFQINFNVFKEIIKNQFVFVASIDFKHVNSKLFTRYKLFANFDLQEKRGDKKKNGAGSSHMMEKGTMIKGLHN